MPEERGGLMVIGTQIWHELRPLNEVLSFIELFQGVLSFMIISYKDIYIYIYIYIYMNMNMSPHNI